MSASLIVLLEHSSACCDERCLRGSQCKDMKQLIHHTLLCKIVACKVCLEVKEYVQAHSARCSAPVCPVITCNAWRQYANERDRRNSTLSSYSNDFSVLETLRSKNRTNTSTEPKIRGTYQCGRCRKPKIRPHTCKDEAFCRPAKSYSSSEDTTPEVFPRDLPVPKASAEPVIMPTEFAFHSRRTTQTRSLISESSLMSSRSSDSGERSSALPGSAASRRRASVDFGAEERGLPLPPSSPSRPPTSASPGSFLSKSLDSPLRATIPAGPQQVISLVRKSSLGAMDSSAYLGNIGNFPAFASHSSDADDSSASSFRKRVLSPKSADASSRRREDANKPRLASLPVEPAQQAPPTAEADPALDVAVDEHSAVMEGLQMTPSLSALRASDDTMVLRFRSQSVGSELSRHSSTSDLSGESYEDDGAREISSGAAALTFSDFGSRFPAAFPTWGAGGNQQALPPGVQMVPFYTSVDQYGRQVMVPCWMPPSVLPSAASETETAAQPVTVKPARKPRTRTPTAETNIVSPGKQPCQPRLMAKHPRRKKTTETPTNTATDSAGSGSSGDSIETFSTLETLVSGEMEASLDGSLDVLALELSEGFVLHPARPYCDEDEEDLFKYLDEEMVAAF